MVLQLRIYLYIKNLYKTVINGINNQYIIPYSIFDKLVKLPAIGVCYLAAVRKLKGLIFAGDLKDDRDWMIWMSEHPTTTPGTVKPARIFCLSACDGASIAKNALSDDPSNTVLQLNARARALDLGCFLSVHRA